MPITVLVRVSNSGCFVIETNEIPKTQEDEDNDSGACALCELIMTKLEKMLENNQTEVSLMLGKDYLDKGFVCSVLRLWCGSHGRLQHW